MLELLILVVSAAVLTLMSYRADARLRRHERLPMQWSLTGEVNWTAPRRPALAFIPVIGSIVIGAAAASSAWLPPRPGQEGLALPALLAVAGAFVAMHGLHLRMIERSLRG